MIVNLKVAAIPVVGAILLVGALVLSNQSSQNSSRSSECQGALKNTSYCRN